VVCDSVRVNEDGEPDLRDVLRGLRVFEGELPEFDPERAPAVPHELFAAWLSHAIDAGVREPHAMTLSTVDADGRPSSRVLILKRLSEGRWGFATSRFSRKGIELSQNSWAAVGFYWPEVGRQIRVRGRVIDAGPDEAARDFLARPVGSRAESWVGNQSQVLAARDDLDTALSDATARIIEEPDAVPEHWTRYDLLADEVEFWQADRERRHVRLHYQLTAGVWVREQLWP
jgi:pyridoxamine 5'-phosphate oxidase